MLKNIFQKYKLTTIIFIFTLIRIFLALFIELSNDEVYYHTFALYPDLSHFDHAPMVGWLIQLTTINMLLHNDFFMRMGPIILSIINTILIFQFTKSISNKQTATYSAIFFNLSFYNSIIAGFFIMPDSGMLTFWIIAVGFFLKALIPKNITIKEIKYLFLASIATGLAMLSKYHSLILWTSAILYILIYNSKWLLKYQLYLAGITTLIVFLPVIIWNVQNDFISFTFQGERVAVSNFNIRFDNFFTEFVGQILYNNPINLILIIFGFVYLLKKQIQKNEANKFLILFGLPLPILFLTNSLFNTSLPHWSGPGYLTLTILAIITINKKLTINLIYISTTFFVLSVIIIVLHIQFQIFPINANNDPTSDVSGWKQLNNEFVEIRNKDLSENNISPNHIILSNNWFPASHLDFYLAEPNNIKLIVSGSLNNTHKYAWINDYRGGVDKNCDAYYFTNDTIRKSAEIYYLNYFSQICKPKKIILYRSNKTYQEYFLYILKHYNGKKLYDTPF